MGNKIESENEFTITQAKRAAIAFAEDSKSRNCLYIIMPDESDHDENFGDAETLESLSEMVVSEGVDDYEYEEAKEEVLAELEKVFPSFA